MKNIFLNLEIFLYLFAINVSFLYLIVYSKSNRFSFFFKKVTSEYGLHKNKIYSNAGLLIILILILFIFIANSFFEMEWIGKMPRPYIFVSTITFLLILSFVDYRKSVNPVLRLLIQLVLVYFSLATIKFPIESLYFLPLKVQHFLVVCFWIYIINTNNFIDGADGMSASFAIGACICVIIGHLFSYNYIDISSIYTDKFLFKFEPAFFLAYVLLPLLLSFYIFNFPPAKIFLGDVGSVPLGYIIGYLMIYMLSINEFFIFFTMFLYPILDVGFNLIRKTISGIYPWSRLFDYYFLIPVIKGKKKHLYVLKYAIGIIVITIILNILNKISLVNSVFLFLVLLVSILILLFHFNSFRKK